MKNALDKKFYTFNPSAKTLDFSALSGFVVEHLLSVIHVPTGKPIYLAVQPGPGYTSVSGAVVTLAYDTTGLSASDPLCVVYDLPSVNVALDGTDPASPAVANSGTGIRGWLATIAGLLKLGPATEAQSASVTIATDQNNLEPAGAAITGTTMPAGGLGLTGWLSALYAMLSQQVSSYVEASAQSVAASGLVIGTARPLGSPALGTKFNSAGLASQAGRVFVQGSNDAGFTNPVTLTYTDVTPGGSWLLTVPAVFPFYRSYYSNTNATAGTVTFNTSYTKS